MKTAAEIESFDAYWLALPEKPFGVVGPRQFDLDSKGVEVVPGSRERECVRCGDTIFVSPATLANTLVVPKDKFRYFCWGCTGELSRKMGIEEEYAQTPEQIRERMMFHKDDD